MRASAAALAAPDSPRTLCIGLERGLPLRALMPLLREVLAHAGQMQLTLAEEPPEALAEALRQGGLDLAILPELHPLPDPLSRWRLWTQRIAVLLPEGHPLAARAEIGARELRSGLLLPPASAAAAAAMPSGAEAGPRAAHGAGASAAALEALVALGLGVALLPEGGTPPEGCVARHFSGAEQPVVLAVPAGRPMNAAVSAFVKLARARRWEGA